MPTVQHPRGTRAALDALAGAAGLLPGQIYVLTDEQRIAVALTTGTYETFAREAEAGGGGGGSGYSIGFLREVGGSTRYLPPYGTQPSGTFSATANRLYACYFAYVGPISSLAINVTATGNVARMGIFDSDGPGGGPGTLLAETAVLDVSSTGVKVGTFAEIEITRPFWVALQTGSNAPSLTAATGFNPIASPLVGTTNIAVALNNCFIAEVRNYAALPATFPSFGYTTAGGAPLLAVRLNA